MHTENTQNKEEKIDQLKDQKINKFKKGEGWGMKI